MDSPLVPRHKSTVVSWAVASAATVSLLGVDYPENWLYREINGIYFPYIKITRS